MIKVRLTKDFRSWYEIKRCLKQPFYKAPISHKFLWGRLLFWYIYFKDYALL